MRAPELNVTAQPSRALYLDGAQDPVFATFHAPADPARGAVVLLCAPFGWEEVCAYRSLRWWADRLARAGYGTLRLTLPSTGDSGGNPRDPGRLDAWVAAVASGATWLEVQGGASRVVAVGIGLGGILAYLAAVGGAPISDFVLWGVPTRGRAQVRQLRAFSKLERTLFFEGLASPSPLPAGELEAGGFLLSAETVAALEQVDLNQLDLPLSLGGRTLLLERDGLAIDAGIAESLERSGLAVTTARASGFGQMTSHPQLASPPVKVIEQVIGWLGGGDSSPEDVGPPRVVGVGRRGTTTPERCPVASSSARMRTNAGLDVRETPVKIQHPRGELAAVLTEPLADPAHGLCVLLLNAGAIRRIGPNRAWVEASRRWAARGVPALRVDAEAIGDSDGPEGLYRDDGSLYDPSLCSHVFSAIDFLQARGTADRFVVGGLCAGAYWAFQAALRDDRVVSALMVNPRALVWEQHLDAARDLRALVNQPFSLARLRRAATPRRLRAVSRWLIGTSRRLPRHLGSAGHAESGIDAEIDAALDRFLDSGKRGLMLFSDHEPLEAELIETGRMDRLRAVGNITVERIAVRDHTLRPVWAQARAHEALDRALERELEIVLSA